MRRLGTLCPLIFVVSTTLLVGVVDALYADQIGKFDWHKKLVGRVAHVDWDLAKGADDPEDAAILVSSEQHLVARIGARDAEIQWRHLQEASNVTHTSMPFVTKGKYLYAIANDGRTLRIWDKRRGAFLAEASLSSRASPSAPQLVLAGNVLIALSAGRLFAVGPSDAKIKWSKTVSDIDESDLLRLVARESSVHIVSITSGRLSSREFSTNDGSEVGSASSVENRLLTAEICNIVGHHVICGSDAEPSIAVTLSPLKIQQTEIGRTTVDSVTNSDVYFAAHDSASTRLYEFQAGKERLVYTSDWRAAAVAGAGSIVAFIGDKGQFTIFDAAKGTALAERAAVSLGSDAPVDAAWILTTKNDRILLLLRTADSALRLVGINVKTRSARLLWTRDDDLADALSAITLAAPVGEVQAELRNEFEHSAGEGMATQFVRRIRGQLVQLRRRATDILNALAEFPHLLASLKVPSSPRGVLALFRTVFFHRAGSLSGEPLERDFFGLRRIAVVAGKRGSVVAYDSADGRVLWRRYLGATATPFRSAIGGGDSSSNAGRPVIPLHVLRDTDDYGVPARLAVLFNERSTVVVWLVDPVTGEVAERRAFPFRAKRIDSLPWRRADGVRPLVLIDQNDELHFYPALDDQVRREALPIHLLSVQEEDGGQVKGFELNISLGSGVPTLRQTWSWRLNLAEGERLVAVEGKPFTERVHSAGRVQPDRSVIYKYLRSELVVLAVHSKSAGGGSGALRFWIVDASNGEVVWAATGAGVAAATETHPIHVLHAENWLIYMYWNDRTRRTEAGVVELMAASSEDPAHVQDVTAAQRAQNPATAYAQAYILPQPVLAATLTRSVLGLTTRAVVAGLADGRVVELSRRLLDAMRPAELTQEMREEGIYVPYTPEINIPHEDTLNANRSLPRLRGIYSSAASLESTSLVLATGAVDLWWGRVVPSGTFDVLKDDFDHALIALVLVALTAGSLIAKRLAAAKALAQAWT